MKSKKVSALRKAKKRTKGAILPCMVCGLLLIAFSCGKDNLDSDDPSNDFFLYDNKGNPYDFFYGDEGKKEILSVRKDKVIIITETEVDAKALIEKSVFSQAYNTGERVMATIDPKKTHLGDLWKMPGVVDATYGLEYVDGTLQYPKNVIYAIFAEGYTPEEVLDAAGLIESVEDIELRDPFYKGYYITLNAKLGDILRISRDLFEMGLCIAAQPSFVRQMALHIE